MPQFSWPVYFSQKSRGHRPRVSLTRGPEAEPLAGRTEGRESGPGSKPVILICKVSLSAPTRPPEAEVLKTTPDPSNPFLFPSASVSPLPGTTTLATVPPHRDSSPGHPWSTSSYPHAVTFLETHCLVSSPCSKIFRAPVKLHLPCETCQSGSQAPRNSLPGLTAPSKAHADLPLALGPLGPPRFATLCPPCPRWTSNHTALLRSVLPLWGSFLPRRFLHIRSHLSPVLGTPQGLWPLGNAGLHLVGGMGLWQ